MENLKFLAGLSSKLSKLHDEWAYMRYEWLGAIDVLKYICSMNDGEEVVKRYQGGDLNLDRAFDMCVPVFYARGIETFYREVWPYLPLHVIDKSILNMDKLRDDGIITILKGMVEQMVQITANEMFGVNLLNCKPVVLKDLSGEQLFAIFDLAMGVMSADNAGRVAFPVNDDLRNPLTEVLNRLPLPYGDGKLLSEILTDIMGGEKLLVPRSIQVAEQKMSDDIEKEKM